MNPDDEVEVVVTWVVTHGLTDDGSVTYPQHDTNPECGDVIQIDRYVGTRAEIDAILADGQLDEGEDHHVIEAWDVTTHTCAELFGLRLPDTGATFDVVGAVILVGILLVGGMASILTDYRRRQTIEHQ